MHDKGAYDNYREHSQDSSISSIDKKILNINDKLKDIEISNHRKSPFFVMPKWRKFKFKLKKGVDFKPIIFNESCPWNYVGSTIDGDLNEYAIIIAYIPNYKSIFDFWEEPIDVSFEESESVFFDNSFQKPDWYKA